MKDENEIFSITLGDLTDKLIELQALCKDMNTNLFTRNLGDFVDIIKGE